MSINKAYLAGLEGKALAVRVVFKREAIENILDANKSWAMASESPAPFALAAGMQVVSDHDFKRSPMGIAVGADESEPAFAVYTYLAPLESNLKLGDSVIVVGKYGPCIAHVYDARPVQFERDIKCCEAYAHTRQDGFFFQWIVQVVDYSDYNSMNSARAEWVQDVRKVLAGNSSRTIIKQMAEDANVDEAALADMVANVPYTKLTAIETKE